MAGRNKKEPVLTKRKASLRNKSNRNISGNINALMNNISNIADEIVIKKYVYEE